MLTSFSPVTPVRTFHHSAAVPRPRIPSMQWGLVAALNLLTLGLFGSDSAGGEAQCTRAGSDY